MRSFLLVITSVVAFGCSKGDSATQAGPAPTTTTTTTTTTTSGDPKEKAREIFAQRCVPCHGATGTGDGPASAMLDPKPRAFGDAAWQKSVDDEYLVKIIKFGGAAVGKSVAMPNNPDLDEPVVAGLKDVVRSFDKK